MARRRARQRPAPSALDPLGGPPPAAPASRGPLLALAGALAASAAIQLGYLRQASSDILSRRLIIDARFYDQWALRILHGDRLAQAFYQDPLYAYFLAGCYALFGRHFAAVRVVQILLGLACVVLFYGITARLFGRRAGAIAAALAALYGPLVYYAELLDKTVVSLFLNLCAVACLGRARDRRQPALYGLSGILFGLASWTRGNLLLAAACLGIWTLVDGNDDARRRVGRFAFFAGGAALMTGLVCGRNYAASRDLVLLTSNSGFNFFIGNNPAAVGGYAPPPMVRGIPEFEQEDARAFAEYAVGKKLDRASEVSGFYFRRGLDFIRDRPADWCLLEARKIFLMLNRLEEVDSYSIYYFRDRYVLLRAAFIGFGLVCPLGLLGLWRVRARGVNDLHVFGVAYAASLAAFFVTSRYRFPLLIALVPFAAAYLDGLWSDWKSLSPAGWAARLAPLGAAILFCRWTPGWMNAALRLPALSTGYTLAGYEYYTEEDDPSAAIRDLETAERIDPGDYLNYLYLADCYGRTGDDVRALANYEKVVRINPLRDDAWNNIGVLRFKRGELKEALEAFDAALRLKPYESRYRENRRLASDALRSNARR